MARYVVVAQLQSAPITYLYDDAAKALAKVRTLQRQAVAFQLQGVSGEAMTVAELEKRAGE